MEAERKNKPELTFLFILIIVFIGILVFTKLNLYSKIDSSKLPESINAEEFYYLAKDSNNIILDLQTIDEYKYAHIGGAVHIDSDSDFKPTIATLDKSKTYLIYCQNGKLSGNCLQTMKELGFNNFHLLKYGLLSWKLDNRPTIKEPGK